MFATIAQTKVRAAARLTGKQATHSRKIKRKECRHLARNNKKALRKKLRHLQKSYHVLPTGEMDFTRDCHTLADEYVKQGNKRSDRFNDWVKSHDNRNIMHYGLRLLLPALIGYMTSYVCPMTTETRGEHIPFRPPSYVFRAVWPILYIMIGLAWVKNGRTVLVDSVYTSVSVMLALWIYVFSCRKEIMGSIYVMLLSITSVISGIIVSDNTASRLLLAPLLSWLVFALLLNTHVL